MSLEPMTIDIKLTGALSLQNIRINTPSTFTVGVSTDPDIMLNAAERLLGLSTTQIITQAEDIILGQLRLVIATLTIEQINQDRELFLKQVNMNVATELNKIGLQLINVNIKDITDESDYIVAIGRKSAAEAIEQARVEVAIQERNGAIGESKAQREREVEVASEKAEAEKGKKEAEKVQRIALARLEAEAVTSEAESEKSKQIEIARRQAETDQFTKEAEMKKRIAIADYEADAVEGENKSKAEVANYEATLAEKKASARQRSEVARAAAEEKIFASLKEVEQRRLEKDEVVRREIEKRKVQIDAEAEAEQKRRIAKGEADAILARYAAEAEGIKQLLEGKADGYRRIIESCDNDKQMAATLLLLEKMEELVAHQVEAIANLKIDKITVWDSGNGSSGSTAGFLRSLVTSLPPLQDIAKQAGIELPEFLGTLKAEAEAQAANEDSPDAEKRN
jgi:flotillin